MKHLFVLIMVTCITSTGAASEQPALVDSVEFPVVLDQEGFLNVIARTGRFYISGQPEEASFSWIRDQGVNTVICLRTQPELDNRGSVPFDEDSLVCSLGMNFIHIPLGGEEHPYSPEALERFAREVERANGKILLHCTVAWRASHLWAAYLVRYKGMEVMDAIAHGKAIEFGSLPFEGFLGGSMKLIIEKP